MSIAVNTGLRLSGYGQAIREPELPLGQWHAGAAIVGDASGGSVSFTTTLVRGFAFSVEGVHSEVLNPGVALTAILRWNPQEVADRQSQSRFIDYSASGAEQVLDGRFIPDLRQLSLSNPLAATPAVTSITLQITSNVNLKIYQCHFWGYYWDVRAWRSPGGPSRP